MTNEIELIYDGNCPICMPCVNAFELEDASATLHKINARVDNENLLAEIHAAGMDVNKGLVIRHDGTLHYAADAMLLLARMGTKKGVLNWVNSTFFKYKAVATVCYPLLKAVRRLLFWSLRIPMIPSAKANDG
jgi:predicted DCC family thiol-disulfide oxidoreductase YuxK